MWQARSNNANFTYFLTSFISCQKTFSARSFVGVLKFISLHVRVRLLTFEFLHNQLRCGRADVAGVVISIGLLY